jgi:hypothetical protein
MRNRNENRKARKGKESGGGPIPLSCPDHRSFPVSVPVRSGSFPRFGPGPVPVCSWSGFGSGSVLVRSGPFPCFGPCLFLVLILFRSRFRFRFRSFLLIYIYRLPDPSCIFRITVSGWFLSGLVPVSGWQGFRFRCRFGMVPVPPVPTRYHQGRGTGFF